MKKVRYALGAGLVPAFGLTALAPGGHVLPKAAHAQTTAPVRNKVAVPFYGHVLAPNISINCSPIQHSAATHSAGFYHFSETVGYRSTPDQCVGYVAGVLHRSQFHLWMRVRTYQNGALQGTMYVANGLVSRGETFFNAFGSNGNGVPKISKNDANKVCAALVNSGNVDSVKYGPLCIAY
jgi:hypothetical protein